MGQEIGITSFDRTSGTVRRVSSRKIDLYQTSADSLLDYYHMTSLDANHTGKSPYGRGTIVKRNRALTEYIRCGCFALPARRWSKQVGFATHQVARDANVSTSCLSLAFPRTLHHLFLHPPVAVLVPDNALASSLTSRPGARNYRSSNVAAKDEPSLLVQCIEAKTGIQCQAVPRAHWNRDEGELLYEAFSNLT
jgi:hypothetical protein